jgi:tRNA (guanosine-2'-O-)-methyltransferase
MRQPTQKRQQRIREVLQKRQPDLTLIMDNIHDPHNVSAILRSCDAFGVYRVHLYYTTESFPKIGGKSSASTRKWVYREKHTQAEAMIKSLRQERFRIAGTGFGPQAIPVTQWDLSQPSAIILGNEHSGLSPELKDAVDTELYIPMQGMVQSLNVSVAAAVILYEAWRQRDLKHMYESPSLESRILEMTVDEWLQK